MCELEEVKLKKILYLLLSDHIPTPLPIVLEK